VRVGAQPSSEADLYRGGAVPLEWCEVSPEGGWADCLTGRGPVGWFCACVWVCFAFVFYEFKRVTPGCLGDPYGCLRQICTLNADIHENSGTPMGIGDGEAANVIAPVSPDGDHF
jgi:hypothetical protein